MIIEEGEGVVIDDPRYSGALKMFFAVFLRKEEGNIAETIVPRATDIEQIADRFRRFLYTHLAPTNLRLDEGVIFFTRHSARRQFFIRRVVQVVEIFYEHQWLGDSSFN